MDHVHLARWADLLIACPATSNLINKLAAGIADDAVGTLWQAAHGTGRPMLIAPAMNTRMWEYPATQASVEKLRSWGVVVLAPGEGPLACGEEGAGRLPDPERILALVDEQLGGREKPGRYRVLVTAGGTREPIDSVRYIGNTSTGRTAAVITERLARVGHELTWLGAIDAQEPCVDCVKVRYASFRDLDEQLRSLLGGHVFDLVVHAAAVSDFSVSSFEGVARGEPAGQPGKLPSGEGLKLYLKPNPKLLDRLRGYSVNPAIRIIGFKLTHTGDEEQRKRAVDRLFEAGIDAVVHNDMEEIRDGRHPYSLHTGSGAALACENSDELAERIDELMRVVS